MSQNTDIVAQVQQKMADELLPAIKDSEKTQVNLSGETIDVPQQVQARLKQKVTAARVECVTLLNQIN